MDILQQLNQIAQERDLPLEDLVAELEEALAAAYKKYVGSAGEVVVKLDSKTGWTANVEKEVVHEVTEPSYQVSIVEARRRNPEAVIGDFIPTSVDPNRFGRIAAQTAKQVLQQKLREAENRRVHSVFSDKLNDLVTGAVTRREGGVVFIQANRVEAELPKKEQVPTEPYRPNDRLKVYVLRVDDSYPRRLRVTVSRTHPNLLRKLFELEVPEIASGAVVINSVAREPGQRSKIAVSTHDERIDPIGACIGPRGARVQAIVDELNDEKIDVVLYNTDLKKFVTDALSPAKVNSLKLTKRKGERGEDEDHAYVVVPDSQLSLAIGKGGQNVRLAARLTDCKIDIRGESQAAEDKAKENA